MKSHRPQPGLNPRTMDLEVSTLPRDHLGQQGLLLLTSKIAYYRFFNTHREKFLPTPASNPAKIKLIYF
jgi:hypothetical protein